MPLTWRGPLLGRRLALAETTHEALDRLSRAGLKGPGRLVVAWSGLPRLAAVQPALVEHLGEARHAYWIWAGLPRPDAAAVAATVASEAPHRVEWQVHAPGSERALESAVGPPLPRGDRALSLLDPSEVQPRRLTWWAALPRGAEPDAEVADQRLAAAWGACVETGVAPADADGWPAWLDHQIAQDAAENPVDHPQWRRRLKLVSRPGALGLEATMESADTAARLWSAWTEIVGPAGRAEMAVAGDFDQITTWHESLSACHRGPELVVGLDLTEGPDLPGGLGALVTEGGFAHKLRHWAVVWPALQDQTTAVSGSLLIERGQGRRHQDLLSLRLSAPPFSASMKAALERLSLGLGTRVGEPTTWWYEAPAAHSEEAAPWVGLRDEIQALADAHRDRASPVHLTHKPGATTRFFDRFRSTVERPAPWMGPLVREAFEVALPDFTYDRAAHPSDAFRLDFVRDTDDGRITLQVVRQQRPLGFGLRIAISAWPLAVDELDAGAEAAPPGAVVPFEALLPGIDEPLVWYTWSPRALKAALREALPLLLERAVPFVDEAVERVARRRPSGGV